MNNHKNNWLDFIHYIIFFIVSLMLIFMIFMAIFSLFSSKAYPSQISDIKNCPNIEGWFQPKNKPDFGSKKYVLIHDSEIEIPNNRLKYIPLKAFYFINENDKKDVVIILLSTDEEKYGQLFEIRWFNDKGQKMFYGNMCSMSDYDTQAKIEGDINGD